MALRYSCRFHTVPSAGMNLAIFDLDNTLLAGDSDYLWGQFLVEQNLVDGRWYAEENRRFYEAYGAGTLDILEFLRFSLKPLRDNDPAQLREWRRGFVAKKIMPVIAPATRELLARHAARGDERLIITATNRFVTEPIAAELGIHHLLATDPEMRDGRYTGEVSGVPCFQQGKVERLRRWLEDEQRSFRATWFYSDSHNDLPLLRQVDHPVAVDPDPALRNEAEAKRWPVVSLRGPQSGADVFAAVAG
jgi:HAD superfamily hydrolase (TIGR01490 family)